jgi:hypothetical protein
MPIFEVMVVQHVRTLRADTQSTFEGCHDVEKRCNYLAAERPTRRLIMTLAGGDCTVVSALAAVLASCADVMTVRHLLRPPWALLCSKRHVTLQSVGHRSGIE